jgi:TolB protein
MTKKTVIFFLLITAAAGTAAAKDPNIGIFDGSLDVGNVYIAGSTAYDSSSQKYLLSGSGSMVRTEQDQFHFVWKRVAGNFIIRARIAFSGPGVAAARRVGCMVRNNFDQGSPQVNAGVEGGGVTSIEHRTVTGWAATIKLSAKIAPTVIQLERKGTSYIMSTAVFGETFKRDTVTNITLADTAYVGIFICSNDSVVLESAVFSNVQILKPAPDNFQPNTDYYGVNVEMLDVDSGYTKVLYTTAEPWMSPNLKMDNINVIFNKIDGGLYVFNLATKTQVQIPTGTVNSNNNDHVLSPDETLTGISAGAPGASSAVYTVGASGGIPKLVTTQGVSYLHGWSPDGKFLVFTGMRNNDFDVYRIPVAGGAETRLTTALGLDDGPEYSPDGMFIFFHSNRNVYAKIWCMNPDGSNQQQLTFDSFNDWFPHPSRDGKRMVFLTFGPEVASGDHPFYKQVYIRTLPIEGGNPRVVAYVYGGQGSFNVPSWTSDSKKVVFFSNTQIVPNLPNAISVVPSGGLVPQAYIFSSTGATAKALFDTNMATNWGGQGYPQSFEIDLGAAYSLTYVNVLPAAQRAYQFLVEAKADSAGAYAVVLDARTNSLGDALVQKKFNDGSTGRFIRVTVTGASGYSGGAVSLNEFHIFGGLNIPLGIFPGRQHYKAVKEISLSSVLAHPESFKSITVYNSAGRMIGMRNGKEFIARAHNLPRGVYILKAQSGDGSEKTFRFIRKMAPEQQP